MATTVLKMARGKLTWGQISFFIFGSTWSFLDKAFPFSSENERETLWKGHKTEVIRPRFIAIKAIFLTNGAFRELHNCDPLNGG